MISLQSCSAALNAEACVHLHIDTIIKRIVCYGMQHGVTVVQGPIRQQHPNLRFLTALNYNSLARMTQEAHAELKAWKGSRLWCAVHGALALGRGDADWIRVIGVAPGEEQSLSVLSEPTLYHPNAAATRVVESSLPALPPEASAVLALADSTANSASSSDSLDSLAHSLSSVDPSSPSFALAKACAYATARSVGTSLDLLPESLQRLVREVDHAISLLSGQSLPRLNHASTSTFYITTAINYANGAPHMGHAYESITSDVIARYHRVYGRDVLFVTGSDEHGQKIADTAEGFGETPQELVDRNVDRFKSLNSRLQMDPDDYIRTTAARHKECCEWIFNRSYENGDIYLGEYEGWYNVRTETFVTEQEAFENNYTDPTSGKPLKKMKEQSYFFQQSKYYEKLVHFLKNNPEFIQPENRRNEIISRLETDGLLDLSISRTNITWGIPVPNDNRHVLYVWFDALTNYLTVCDAHAPDSPLTRFWPADVHIIGKDIVWFHTVIWPCMLWSAGLSLPKTVFGHGFVLAADGQKMSKSLNNIVDPHEVLDHYPADSFRYFTSKAGSYGADVPFSKDGLAQVHNSELTDTLGNLLHRATSLCNKMCNGVVPHATPDLTALNVKAFLDEMEHSMASYELNNACDSAMNAARQANRWLTEQQPWKMQEHAAKERVIRSVLEAVYVIAHFLHPFIPSASVRISNKLSTQMIPMCCLSENLDNLQPNTPVHVGDVLFSKVEESSSAGARQEANANGDQTGQKKASGCKKGQKQQQNDASRLELRVGIMREVERHPDADKLLVEKVDLGESELRTVVSGIAGTHTPEQLRGNAAVFICNIKPVAMRGVRSQAMVLAAADSEGKNIELVQPPSNCQAGARVLMENDDGTESADDEMKTDKRAYRQIASQLVTNEKCEATFDGSRLVLQENGSAVKVSSLVNAQLS